MPRGRAIAASADEGGGGSVCFFSSSAAAAVVVVVLHIYVYMKLRVLVCTMFTYIRMVVSMAKVSKSGGGGGGGAVPGKL